MASTGKKRSMWQRFCACMRVLFILSVCLAGVIAGLAAALVAEYSRGLPDVNRLREYQPSATTRVFASNGELIATLYRENRTWIPLKDVPPCMRQAIIASEDARFYQHPGVDVVGMARVLWWVARSRGLSQGASTITMQLARSVFLSDEVTVRRKVQEMLVSLELERRFSKDELLEFYLNQIYFGSGAYGVQAAAETYFGKKAAALDLAESAMLVGVVPAPSDYSPLVNLKLARERQALVLRRMVDVGSISAREARAALAEPVRLARPRKDGFVLKYPYFTTYVLRQLAVKYGEDVLYRGGLRIYTTLDPAVQEAGQEAVQRGVRTAAGQNVSQAALAAIEPQTGYIKAMVGGTGWSDQSQFNRAWQAERPAGSSFKIFVYATAVENGFAPDTIVSDAPVTMRVGPGDYWSPKNSDGRFMGAIPLRTALQHSRNAVSARLVECLTPARVVDTAYKMGVRSHVDPLMSIALGAASVSPLDMASALAVLANGGRRVEPCAVKLIEDADGKIVEDHRQPTAERVLSPATAFAMTEMMEAAVNQGTGYGARLKDRPAAGKTGTTDAHRDAWFCGFVPQLAAAVWVGNDDDSPMCGTYGGDAPASIWGQFMAEALSRRSVEYFGADGNGKVSVPLCEDSGRRAVGTCPHVEMKPFERGSVPQRFCSTHVFAGGGEPAPASPVGPTATPEGVGETAPPDEPMATPVDTMPPEEEGGGQSPAPARPGTPQEEPPPGESSEPPPADVPPPGEPAEPPRPTPADPPRPTPS